MSYASLSYGNQNRDEYTMMQNAWYPTEEYEVRSRLDSGSFSNSSGSTTGDGKKKRRSHRPRGCRGGGARRARKALREQARAREAMQENVVQHGGLEYAYPPQYIIGNGGGEVFKEKQNMYCEMSPVPLLQPCMSTLSTESSGSHDLFNVFPPAAAASSSNYYVDSQGNTRCRVPYGAMTYTGPSQVSNRFSSEKAASRSVGSSLAVLMSLKNRSAKEQPQTVAEDFSSVLPPPLVDSREKEPDKLEGPNPYALKSNLRCEVESYQPSSALRADAELFNPSMISNDSEDQENPILDGGSLFATSPRSFLTGGRRKTPF